MKEYIRFIVSLKNEDHNYYFNRINERIKKDYGGKSVVKEVDVKLEARISFTEIEIYKVLFYKETYSSMNINVSIFTNDHYNIKNLEELKIKIKNILLKKINQEGENNKCYWLKDLQIEEMSINLYSDFHRLENQLRSFINKVLCNAIGCNWLNEILHYLPSRLEEKHTRGKSRRGQVSSFSNVDDFLFSLDTGDLIDIIKLEIKEMDYREIKKLDSCLKSLEKEKNIDSFLSKINSMKEVRVDFWKNHFKNYLKESFIECWADFEKNRNHVMHNKPLDVKAYQKIKENISEVEFYLDAAEKMYIETEPSKETIEEIESEQQWIEAQRQRSETQRQLEEAGLEISEGQIKYIFDCELENIVNEVEDLLYFREDLNLETFDLSLSNRKYLEITYTVKERGMQKFTLEKVEDNIYEDQGMISEFIIVAKADEEEISRTWMTYTNPTVELHEDHGYYMPASEGYLELDNNSLFKEKILEKIGEIFPTIQDEESNFWNKDDNLNLLYEGECPECGYNSITIGSSKYDKGLCLNCGEKHEEIEECSECLRSSLEVSFLEDTTICKECFKEKLDVND